MKKGGIIVIVAPDYNWKGIHFYDIHYTHNFVTTKRRICGLLLDNGFEICYSGHETMSIHSDFITALISLITRMIYWTRIPFIIGKMINNSERIEKIKFSLLRSSIVIGRLAE